MGPIQTAANHPEYMLKNGGGGGECERKRDTGAGRNGGWGAFRSADRKKAGGVGNRSYEGGRQKYGSRFV